jgi:hypothetical protein
MDHKNLNAAADARLAWPMFLVLKKKLNKN